MRFLVHVKIKPTTTEKEIVELLPAEQARFAELVEQGLIKSFYLSHTMDEHWSICIGDSLEEVRVAVESLPFYKFMAVEYTALVDDKR
ncbi:hypothetical protein E4V51_16435 [Paenibacillus sp. 28ISP30-2]|uniref:muconolactone Delta-isomerase family protein n=1 Tax=Paenibacillus TaxID=44249 RepID=UPI0007204CF1|nr:MULTISPECIES: muconolactone Delta-isomerase family protein [Paenibacillus]ALP37441.1 hypothetical protein ASL14_15870 [Paenibacillus sp. IHB B 3084]MBE0336642.1 hypothetical protein [Paenibacillus sp. 23TSA30-6]MBE0342394.1 hypothetical protein [Paenibacillus sp. 28ISP30-2]